ncbi:MAG: hypothetical protein MJB14_00565 [Spirochaetes bacterium]|nr:hypothetical protein [Spirochaetota bacterium]
MNINRNIFIILILLITISPLFSEEHENYRAAKLTHENEFPVFMQKGGLMRPGEHAFYIRTNDEWTGFSTFFFGYRYGVSDAFNIALEGGISAVPHVYFAALLLYFRLYETPNKFFFLGMRIRFGYRYQDSDFSTWGTGFTNYLTLQRNGLYLATDLTAALRFGKFKQFAMYYTIYPRVDFDFVDQDNRLYFLFSPGMLGFEARFGGRMRWNIAVEGGYTFPIPWNSIEEGKWVNFPSLANISLSYRLGDQFYNNYQWQWKYRKKERKKRLKEKFQ